MAMDAGEIERLIKAGIPDAQVTIRDLAGDGDHYAATVISASFKGKSRVQQHQLVYEALKGQMGGVLHALALQTATPERLMAPASEFCRRRAPSRRPGPGASARAPAISSSSPACAASIPRPTRWSTATRRASARLSRTCRRSRHRKARACRLRAARGLCHRHGAAAAAGEQGAGGALGAADLIRRAPSSRSRGLTRTTFSRSRAPFTPRKPRDLRHSFRSSWGGRRFCATYIANQRFRRLGRPKGRQFHGHRAIHRQ